MNVHPPSRALRIAGALLLVVALGGCRDATDQVLGTLEYDRITLPAPAAERIASIAVHEGDRVKAGAEVMTLETARTAAQTDAARAQAQQQRDALAELEAGTRSEQLAQARAQLARVGHLIAAHLVLQIFLRVCAVQRHMDRARKTRHTHLSFRNQI